MTIEPSLIVWTVLCFIALLVILKKLLFQPMLKFMDERSEKIRSAREARESAQRERDSELQRRKEACIAEEAHQREEASARIEKLHEEAARLTAEKRAEAEQKLRTDRETLKEESERICRELEPELPGLAQNIVNHLQRWQDDSHSAVDSETVAAPYADIDALRRQTVRSDSASHSSVNAAGTNRGAIQKAAEQLGKTLQASRNASAPQSEKPYEDDPQLSELATAFLKRLRQREEERPSSESAEQAKN